MLKKYLKKDEEKDISLHTDAEQKEILSYLCEIHGLETYSKRYREIITDISYWAESDYLTRQAIKNSKPENTNKIKHVLLDLLKYAAVIDKSRGIIHYNIALIAYSQGNQKEVDEHLEKAKKLIPELIQKRLEIEPIWKNKDISDKPIVS